MVEGSLWVYGHTRLSDFYRSELSLRELWNRIRALPDEAPLWLAVEAEHERLAPQQRATEIDQALAAFRR